jgi:hypothetical protein
VHQELHLMSQKQQFAAVILLISFSAQGFANSSVSVISVLEANIAAEGATWSRIRYDRMGQLCHISSLQ